MKKRPPLLLWIFVASLFSCTQLNAELQSAAASDAVSIEYLQSRSPSAEFELVKNIYQRASYSGDLYSYISDGLKVYSLVNTPSTKAPPKGYPVVVFGHGFHPQPENYGITKTGEVSRPGDYYRGIPESYAENGFLVVSPDYRGHNISEGSEYTKTSYLASSYYASDVLHAIAAIDSLKNVDLDRIYYVGHSMGGDVGLKVLLASKQIKAASLWAPVAATTNEQALYYGKYYDESHAPGDAQVSAEVYAQYTEKVDALYAELPSKITTLSVDPIHYVDQLAVPILLQHARGDKSVPYTWSESLFVKLMTAGKKVFMHTYDTENHLFSGLNKAKAIRRDVEFFNRN